MPDPLEAEKQSALIEKLVALLPSQERDTARAVLSRDDVQSVHLLAHLRKEEQATRRMRAVLAALFGFLLPFFALMVPANARLWFFVIFYALPILGGLGLWMSTLLILFPGRLEKAALEILFASEHPRSIGPLLECLRFKNRSLKAKARVRLLRLLPHLTTETCSRLSPKQRDYLYDLLNYRRRDTDREMRLAVLHALRQAGDRTCLGTVYLLASGDAITSTGQTVREAARECLDHLMGRLEFAPLQSLSRYIDSAHAQMRSEGVDLQVYATCLLNLRELVRQLTPSNYQGILSEWQRDRLYSLLLPYASPGKGQPLGERELEMEIVRAAERVGDTRAIKSFELLARNFSPSVDRSVLAAVQQALPVLEALVEREQESQTLLRGTTAPDAQPGELLRAVLPDASATDPKELLRASPLQQARVSITADLPPEQNPPLALQQRQTIDP